MSQPVFARVLNVSAKTVQSWEQGVRTPQRGDLRLIQIIEKDPKIVRVLFGAPRPASHFSPGKSRRTRAVAVA